MTLESSEFKREFQNDKMLTCHLGKRDLSKREVPNSDEFPVLYSWYILQNIFLVIVNHSLSIVGKGPNSYLTLGEIPVLWTETLGNFMWQIGISLGYMYLKHLDVA